MNEMLGNQYFLARRFKDATTQYERALLLDPNNNDVKKKLIVCYIQQNVLKLALKLFTDLIADDIDLITNSDPTKDDCPCQQMIYEIENSPSKLNGTERDTMLGILWLYCDQLKSRVYFHRLLKKEPDNSVYKKISELINQQFTNKNKVEQNGKERTN